MDLKGQLKKLLDYSKGVFRSTFFYYFFRIAYTLFVITITVLISKEGFNRLSFFIIVSFVLIIIPLEIYNKTEMKNLIASKMEHKFQLERNKFESEQSRLRSIVTDLSSNYTLFYKTTEFLYAQLDRTVRTFNEVIAKLSSNKDVEIDIDLIMKPSRIIDLTLKQICDNLTNIASIKYGILSPEIMFRSTFMMKKRVEIRGNKEERLVYTNWCTPGNNEPRSKSEGKIFKKGEGVAGLAWKRQRVVIEDKFEKGKNREWKDNYPGQGKLYASMACIPVITSLIEKESREDVQGVIKINTNIKGFFGKKNDKDMEDRISKWITPYGSYIAFVIITVEILKRLKELKEREIKNNRTKH